MTIQTRLKIAHQIFLVLRLRFALALPLALGFPRVNIPDGNLQYDSDIAPTFQRKSCLQLEFVYI